MIGKHRGIVGLTLFFILSNAVMVRAQVEEARSAIERGEYVRAVNILSAELADRPTPDAYLLLGIAYGQMKEYQRAEEVLREGSTRYPEDYRYHNELARIYLADNEVDKARDALTDTLLLDPDNSYASDTIATIDMSQGDVQTALRVWNKSGRPIIDDILHNYYLNFGSWVVRKSVAFRPAGALRYDEWKTTEARLLETGNYANVALEVEPTVVPDQYNAVVRTAQKTNRVMDLLFGLVKGVPLKTSYFDIWNIGNSGVNFNSKYRWEARRRRQEAGLKLPIPLPGILFLDVKETWRSEYWDLTPVILSEFAPDANFKYKSTGLKVSLKHIPHYRFEIGGGFEYINRAASGNLPELSTNGQNVGRFLIETNLRLSDGRYQNRLRFEGFAARSSVLGDFDYTGGTAELNNRFTLTRDTRTYLDITLKGGTVRGGLPVEDYFVLGTETNPSNLLRGHATSKHGHYGNGPTGTDFVLMNLDLERRIVTLPLFNTLNIPYLTIKWEAFLDGGKMFDRTHIFQEGKLLVDTGAALRLETPLNSFTMGYGRSLRDGDGIFFGYIERRLW